MNGKKQGSQKRTNRSSSALDISFIDAGLTDGNGLVRADLITTYAQDCGKAFVRGGDRVSSGQLRKFYKSVADIHEAVDKEKDDSVTDIPQEQVIKLKILSSKAAYAKGRKVVSGSFSELIDKCVAKIDSKQDLKAFKMFLEAIIGYYVGFGGERSA